MSTLWENIYRLDDERRNILIALSDKGVYPSGDEKFSDFPRLIKSIEVAPRANTQVMLFGEYTSRKIIVEDTKVLIDFSTIMSVDDMFNGFGSMEYIDLPNNFARIATSARSFLDSCALLKSFTFPRNSFKNVKQCTHFFFGCKNLTSISDINLGVNVLSADSCFSSCEKLTSLDLSGGFGVNMRHGNLLFRNCKNLQMINLPENFASNAIALYNFFSACTELMEIHGGIYAKISFSLSDCTKLTHESLMNVINSLQQVDSQKSLSLGSTNLAKLTDDEKAIATAKGWTLA